MNSLSKELLGILLCFLCFGVSYSQCSSVNVTSPNSVCKNSFFEISTSTMASSYEWDFCTGDITASPTAKTIINSSIQTPYDISIVKDDGKWYCFAVGYGSNTLSRIDLGADPRAGTPVDNNLGNPGGLFSNPTSIKIKKYNGVWVGLVFSQATRSIILLQFGSSLSNTPAATTIATSIGNIEGALDFVQISTNLFAVAVSDFTGNVAIVSFSNGLDGGVTSTNNIAVGGYLVDIEIVENCGLWNVFVLSYSSRSIARLDFGNDLTSSPITTTYSSNLLPFSPYRLWIGKEGDYLNALVTNIGGGIANLDIGIDPTNSSPAVNDFGNLNGAIGASWSIYAIKESNRWTAFTFNGSTSNLISLAFPQINCGATIQNSSLQNPGLLSYTTSGLKNPMLTVINPDGSSMSNTFQIQVESAEASQLDFTVDKICVNSTINFASQSTGAILNSNWDFGDGDHSTDVSPTHQFLSSNTYKIKFTADNALGCKNTVIKNLKIYNPSTATFTSPSGLICTNNEFTFANNTVDNFDGNLTYQWYIDNVVQSTARDLKYTFTSQGDKTIKLVTSIPGCSDESSQIVSNVQSGPTVGFTATGKCEDETVLFTNTSSGAIAGYLWDLGGGQTATTLNTSKVYDDKGNYLVSLETTGVNGCISKTSKNLTIYSKPSPNFSIDLPPFSCSGLPTQITDQTPPPSDSNLALWDWNFGDTAGGTSTDQNPIYTFATAGDYNVSLKTTTNFGCSASIQKKITIAASPPSDFTNTAACVNQGTRFDASGPNIKSWLWNIGNSTYTFSTPTHVFSTTGDQNVKLTVTGSNDCYSTVTKKINVPVPPTLSFSAQNLCEGQPTTFKDTTPSIVDVPISWSWDFASQGTGTGSSTLHTFATSGSYSVKLNSTYQSGCVYALSKSVVITSTPVAAFTASPEWGTPPLLVRFANQSTGASTYLWKFNDSKNSTSTEVSPSFQFIELGDYAVDLFATSALGCTSTVSKKISVIIPSLDVELKELELIKDPTSGAYRMMVTVKNNSNYALSSVDVVVDISGNSLIKETLNTSILPDGEFTQLLNSQILSRGDLFTYLCAAVDVMDDKNLFNNKICEPVNQEPVVFNPYPNPSDGSFQFDWISPAEGTGKFILFNSMGQLVLEQEVESIQSGLNQVQFNLKELSVGAYYIRFTSNSVSKTFPIEIIK